MKKLIAVVALLASFSSSASFGPWIISIKGDTLVNNVTNKETGTAYSLQVREDKLVTLMMIPQAAQGLDDVGEVNGSINNVLEVNGQRVKVVMTRFTTGILMVEPETLKGNTFIYNQFKKANKVELKFGGELLVWYNANGFSAGMDYILNSKAI